MIYPTDTVKYFPFKDRKRIICFYPIFCAFWSHQFCFLKFLKTYGTKNTTSPPNLQSTRLKFLETTTRYPLRRRMPYPTPRCPCRDESPSWIENWGDLSISMAEWTSSAYFIVHKHQQQTIYPKYKASRAPLLLCMYPNFKKIYIQ